MVIFIIFKKNFISIDFIDIGDYFRIMKNASTIL